ncbi:MAG: LysE family translocator [Thermoanaerobaculia bacterium]|nr:LysE family translocator [Thermoanaerobaculia bacterium]
MIETATFLTFLAACIALILAPGPAQLLVISRTLSEGPRTGALTAVGLNIGTLVHSCAAALGLSAILATSALAFSIVKYIGAAYLLYLGIQALRSRPGAASKPTRTAWTHAPLGQAIATGILNPKVAIFFLVFLPQFVDPARGPAFPQFMLLGATMAALDTLYELLLVAVVRRTRTRATASERSVGWRNRISGVTLVALGVRMAFQQR